MKKWVAVSMLLIGVLLLNAQQEEMDNVNPTPESGEAFFAYEPGPDPRGVILIS